MNFEAGRLININVPDTGATPRMMVASEEPVLITSAVVTGGTLKVTASNDGFVADNRIICDVRGAASTGQDWPLCWIPKGDEIMIDYTGTKCSLRTRGMLLDNIDVPDLGASPQTLTANNGDVQIVNATVKSGTLQINVSNDGFVLDNRLVCLITAGGTIVHQDIRFKVLDGEDVKFTYTGGSVEAFVRTINVLT